MSNVQNITGEPFAQPGEPVESVVEALKKVLSLAEAGLIRQIHIIGVTPEGSVEHIAEPGSTIMLAGATTWAAHRLYVSLDPRRSIAPPPEAG